MRIVVKTGSAILTNSDGGLDRAAVERLAGEIAALHRAGHEVILVSSGAIAAGVGRLGLKEKPSDLGLKQAAAAVGQLALMEAYESAFARDRIIPAQMLLTRDDLVDRERYLNVRNTLLHLLALKTVPIINENDCVSTEEIQFGDNDTLSSVVATKVEADKLVLLSDVDGLYEQEDDGRLTSRIVREVERVTPQMEKSASKVSGSKMSVGGMSAKLMAAKMATAAGIETWIGSGRVAGVLARILQGDASAGTRFLAKSQKLASRQSWIAFGRQAKGSLVLDEGALKAVTEQRKSLLPSGVKTVRGNFAVGDTVGLRSASGAEVARGLVNFSSKELQMIRGCHSREVAEKLGRAAAGEVIHRDNLVVL